MWPQDFVCGVVGQWLELDSIYSQLVCVMFVKDHLLCRLVQKHKRKEIFLGIQESISGMVLFGLGLEVRIRPEPAVHRLWRNAYLLSAL